MQHRLNIHNDIRPVSNTGALALLAGSSLSGPLDNAGTVTAQGALNGAVNNRNGGSFTLSGPLSGITGFANEGTLSLAGHDLALGSLTGKGGTVQDASGKDATLSVDTGDYGGVLQDGPGGGRLILAKNGPGTLILSGKNTYTGPTTVNGGTLDLRGSLASEVTVMNGGSLAGQGPIGGLRVGTGGVVSPGGDAIDTLSVAGNLHFAAGSLYRVNVTPTGESDRIAASGAATLAGGTVQVIAGAGQYAPRTRYTILTAGGGVSGQFAGATTNYAFLSPFLSYGPNEVYLTLARNDLQFRSVAKTGNQYGVAGAVEGLGVGSRLYDAVSLLTESQARRAFDLLSGEIHASGTTARFNTAHLVREAILDRLRFDQVGSFGAEGVGQRFAPGTTLPAAYTADRADRSPVYASVPTQLVEPDPVTVWGQGFGSFGTAGGDGNAARLGLRTSGFVVGADTNLDPGLRLGVAGGYTNEAFDVDDRQSTGTIESGFAALYARASAGEEQVRFGASYTASQLSARRNVTFPGFSESLQSSYGGGLAQAFGEVGHRFGTPQTYLEPFVGGALLRISRDGFSETGGVAALTARGRSDDLATSTIGLQGQVRADAVFGVDMSAVVLRGMVGYRRVYGDLTPSNRFSFGATGPSFLTAGVPIARDALVAQGGVDWQIKPNTVLAVAYTGQVGTDRTQEHGVKGNFFYRW